MDQGCITLLNGIRVAHDVVHTVESVNIAILFRVGSSDEKEDENGISHLLEHMNFKGTKKRNAKQIAQEFDMIGGHLNAYTSR